MTNKNTDRGKKGTNKAPVLTRALKLHDRLETQPARPGTTTRRDRVLKIIYNNAPGN